MRRFAFPLLAYAFAAVMVGTTVPTPMYAVYAERLGFGVLTTTVVFAGYTAGVLFALVVFGRWSDALGRRPMLLAGVGCAIVSALVFLIAGSVPQLIAARFVSGMSAGIFTGTATAAVIEAAPERRRSRAAAVATVANIGGLGAGPLLAGILVQYAPWPMHLTFWVHIVLMVLAAAAIAVAPETSPRTGRLGVQRLSLPPQVRKVFAIASLAAFAGFAVTGLFTAVAPSFLAEVIGVRNHAVAGAVAASIFAASAVTQVLGASVSPRRAVAVGCALLIVGMVFLAAALVWSSLPALIATAVVAGAGQGLSFSRGLAAVSARTPSDQRGEVSSTYFVVAYVALLVPVIGEGWAAHHWGLRTAGISFAVGVAVLAIGCLIAILIQESRDPQAI